MNDDLKLIIGTRKLRAKWTIDPLQDLKAYHSIKAEDELSNYIKDKLMEVLQEPKLQLII